MRTRETQAGHVGVPRRVDDPRCTRRSQAALVSRAGTERDRASRRAAANASCASPNGVSLLGKFDESSPPAPSTYAGTGTVRMVW
jgi:hypothetical protein